LLYSGKKRFFAGEMNIAREIAYLLQKDLRLELRSSYAISGILLYVFSTIFIVYISFRKVQPEVWNALFWIIILFASVSAVVKSFVQENSARQLYYYSLAHPIAVILSKILYNILLLLVLSLLTWLGFSFVAGNPVKDTAQFFLALLLGSLGFSITFTFISAISSKADHNATLMAVLSFPLIIPILLTLIKLSANALRLMQDTAVGKDILILLSIDLLLVGLAILLFPFLWRD
jgi:heme exporter protein B